MQQFALNDGGIIEGVQSDVGVQKVECKLLH
jgi:hypothetical protein